jgi:chemosensory pili system protein ChpA (sensor histidine kinase/response regulator)
MAMDRFCVDDIRDVFRSDIEGYIAVTRENLGRYAASFGAAECGDFDQPCVGAHAMKGVGAMVQAWGLSYLGEDLETLYDLARSFHHGEPERARQIAVFVLELLPRWEMMLLLTLGGDLDGAEAVYREIRQEASGRYDGYLVKRDSKPAAELVLGNDSQDETSSFAPLADAAGVARRVATPAFKIESEPVVADGKPTIEPVSTEHQTVLVTAEMAGVARRVAPPKLKFADQPDNDNSSSAESDELQKPRPAPSAAGIARKVAPPNLKLSPPQRPDEETDTARKQVRREVFGDRPAHAAGFARRVAPPMLKVLGGADAIVESAETTPPAAAPAAHQAPQLATAKPSPDEDLRSVFREEAAIYLEDLSTTLGSLVADPASEEPWGAARRLCHTIKGSAAMVGLDETSERGGHAEKVARSAQEDASLRTAEQAAEVEKTVREIAASLGLPFEVKSKERTVQPVGGAPQLSSELAEAFLFDAREQIETLESALLAWERGENVGEQRDAVFRAYHTLKGAANSIGLGALGQNLHAAESVVERSRLENANLSHESFAFFFRTVDDLKSFERELSASAAAAWKHDWQHDIARLEGPAAAPAPLASGDDFAADLIQAFAFDARDHAVQLERAALAWERDEKPEEQIQSAFRTFHTLKGAANSSGLPELGANCHAAEALLDLIGKRGLAQAPTEIINFLLVASDAIGRYATTLEADPNVAWTHDWRGEVEQLQKLAGRVEEGAQIALPSAEEIETAPTTVDYIRVEAGRVRKLMNQVGELVVERNRFSAKLERAIQLRQLLGGNRQRLLRMIENFQDSFEYSSAQRRVGGAAHANLGGASAAAVTQGAAAEFSEIEFDRYDEFNMLSRALTEVADDLGQVTVELERLIDSFRNDEHRFGANSRVLQEDITTLTSQPIEGLFRRLERIFRDAVQAEKKEAVLRFEGSHATLDRSIIERLYTPLLHLVRNAVAHGIEPTEKREASGKTRIGTVTVSAEQSSNQIIITVRDDGGGISREAVLAKAKERKIVGEEVVELSDQELLRILFTPGFSTASAVSTVAGRGVGLDVVDKEVESMNGSVSMETSPGNGTVWKLRLPLTLAVSEAVIIGVDTQEFAVPLNFVASGLLIESDGVSIRDGVEYYHHAGRDYRLLRLARCFELPETTEQPRGIIVSVGEGQAVLMVDRVPARREIVIKGFDALLARHPFLEGATLDSEGRPVLILNAPALLKLASSKVALPAAPKTAQTSTTASSAATRKSDRLTALVVDDSLSVRTVQDRLLSDLGCDVVLATDGLDAVEQLRQRSFDIIFTDLEMPRMNGYDLISTVRLNPNWNSVPIVLVTSRAAQKHIDKAMQLGANGYLTKPFNQEDLESKLVEHAGFVAR